MSKGRLKGAMLNLVLLSVSVSIFFGLAELAARATFPEFANQIHSQELTAGKRIHNGEVFGLVTRLPAAKASMELSPGSPVVLVVGDSVTKGYGVSYHDTFWAVWQRYFRMQSMPDTVISLSGYGNNFKDSIESVARAIEVFRGHGAAITAVIYQFNFNDLLPSTRTDLQEFDEEMQIWERLKQGTWIAHLRHELLNYSVFLRVLTIKGSSLFHSQSASLLPRTWTKRDGRLLIFLHGERI